MGPSAHFYSCMGLMLCDKQVFRGLTGCQRDPRDLGRHNTTNRK